MEQIQQLTIQVKYACGCGFVTESPAAANRHVVNFIHVVTVNGTISPPKEIRRHSKKFREEEEY